MPRSGSRSKKNREKARQAATTSNASTPSATTNTFAALAPPEQGGPAEANEGQADDEEEEEEEEEAAGAAATLEAIAAAAAADIPANTASPTLDGAAGKGSSLAEDILAAPSTLAAYDPVRIETAAYMRKYMLDGTTLLPWVIELVLPPSETPVGGPTSR